MNHLGQITIELFFGFFVLLIATKILGKTQISQLTPFDFISAIVLGETSWKFYIRSGNKSMVYFICSTCMGSVNLYNRSDNAKI